MELKEIQDLIKFVSKTGVSEVEIEKDKFKITIKKAEKKEEQTVILQQPQQIATPQVQPVVQQQQPQQTQQPVQEQAAPKESTADSKHDEIKSPMIGTFYRRPSPDKPNFVEVGDTVKAGDVICIIEAMKLFNEIEAEVSGTIVKILADDSTPVEYDQPLFLIDPA